AGLRFLNRARLEINMSPHSQTEPVTVEAASHYLINLDVKPVSHYPPPGGGLPWREGTAEGLALPSFLD
ncbi:MAG: hypothetical protein OTJ97_10570, partial [SAR202 cluster bacterium]|nr:hypothetical protein [SAR202 cluster bacterium]